MAWLGKPFRMGVALVEGIVRLIYTTVMASASGALSPGPLTVATFVLGTHHGWRRGLQVGLGHMLVELPYVLLLYLFISSMKEVLSGMAGDVIALLGTAFIVFFAVMVIRDAFRSLRSGGALNPNGSSRSYFKHPILVGALLTGLNVWFLIWWLSIGFGLILLVAEAGIVTMFVMFASHIWIDFLWLALVAEAGRRGVRVAGLKGYGILMVLLGVLLALFGVNLSLKRFLYVSVLP